MGEKPTKFQSLIFFWNRDKHAVHGYCKLICHGLSAIVIIWQLHHSPLETPSSYGYENLSAARAWLC